MSALGYLFAADGVEFPDSALFVSLAEAKRAGLDFETAWTVATRSAGRDYAGLSMSAARGEVSHYDFARARFERAYYGLDPSIRTCQAVHACPRPATADGLVCDEHAHNRSRVRALHAERQEAIAV